MTFVKDAPKRFFPVRVTVVPPSTEPNLGSILSSSVADLKLLFPDPDFSWREIMDPDPDTT